MGLCRVKGSICQCDSKDLCLEYVSNTKKLKQVVSKEIRLQIIIKIINNIAKYDNLILILLVFDTFPRIINNNISTLFTIKRVKVINLIIIEIAKLYVKR